MKNNKNYFPRVIFFYLSFVISNYWSVCAVADSEVMSRDFVQVRVVKELSHEIRSEGRLVLSSEKGMVWSLITPVKVVYVINDNGIYQVRDRKAVPVYGVGGQMGLITSIFDVVLTGELEALTDTFDLKDDGVGLAELMPLNQEMMPGVIRIQVKYDQVGSSRQPTQIEITEASGITRIEFTGSRDISKQGVEPKEPLAEYFDLVE